jgi:hypothetical protein
MGTNCTDRFPSVFWALFPFILPRRLREQVYEPSYQELLEDYHVARRSYRTKWARRWLTFCFTLRTLVLVAQCFGALLSDRGWQVLKWTLFLLFGEEAVRRVLVILRL